MREPMPGDQVDEVQVQNMLLEDWDGPWVGAAAFCELVLVEKDGSYSIVRIIDILNVDRPQPAAAGDGVGTHVELTLFMLLRSGIRPMNAQVRVRQHTPDNAKHSTPVMPIALPGDGQGVPVQIKLGMAVTYPGRYWFDIMIDDLIITRVPLIVRFQHSSEAMNEGQGSSL